MAEPNRQQAIEIGRNLFAEFKINKVVIIDDDFFVDFSNRKTIRDFCFEHDGLVRKHGGPDLREPIEDVDYQIDSWFTSLNQSAKEKLLTQFKKKSDKDVLPNLKKAFEAINKKQPICLSYNDWNKNKEDLLQKSEGMLFIVDLDFRKEEKSENFGKELIESIKAEAEGNAKFGLMSSHFKDAQEIENWTERFGGDEFSGDYFPIAKNFEKTPTSLIRGLESLLLHQKLFPLSKLALESLEISFEKTKAFIHGLDVYSLVSVLKSQKSDGNWPVDGVAELSLMYMRPQITKSSRKYRKEINDLFVEAFGIIDRCKLPFEDITIKKYREKTAQVIRYDTKINKFNLPIANGDIFLIGSQHFILLCQPCDTILREDGTRFLETGSLFEIGDWGSKTHPVIPYFSGINTRVHFGKSICIPFDVLDLCVLSSSGKAKIESIKTVSLIDLVPSEIWEIRKENLLKSLKTPKQYEVKGIASLNFDEKTRSYNIKRISRLLEPYASAMLSKLIQRLSRPALPAEIN